MRLFQIALLVVGALTLQGGSRGLAQDVDPGPAPGSARSHLRIHNDRIDEALQYAIRRAPSFARLVTALEALDRVVYIEAGRCAHREVRSCLNLMTGHEATTLVIHLDPRQEMRCVVAQLAHELYHALEIAREPDVVDVAAIERLYERIGERSCSDPTLQCHETRAALAFEALVGREVSSAHRATAAADR
jgi:hypothetical protein